MVNTADQNQMLEKIGKAYLFTSAAAGVCWRIAIFTASPT
jgi:hypothetical protein